LIPHLTTPFSRSPNFFPTHPAISAPCASRKYPSPCCKRAFEADLTKTRSTASRSLRDELAGRMRAGDGVCVPISVKMKSWERKKTVLSRVELNGTG
jgi:hypothetical protein